MSFYSKKYSPVYTAALVGTGRIGFSLGIDKKREQEYNIYRGGKP